MKISTEDIIKELKRELATRERVYPKWIQSGKMHRDVANRRYMRLKAALEIIEGKQIANTGKQTKMF